MIPAQEEEEEEESYVHVHVHSTCLSPAPVALVDEALTMSILRRVEMEKGQHMPHDLVLVPTFFITLPMLVIPGEDTVRLLSGSEVIRNSTCRIHAHIHTYSRVRNSSLQGNGGRSTYSIFCRTM